MMMMTMMMMMVTVMAMVEDGIAGVSWRPTTKPGSPSPSDARMA